MYLKSWSAKLDMEPRCIRSLVEDESRLDEEIHQHQALGTQLERQDLHCVGDEQSGPGKGVGSGEEEYHSDYCFASGFVAV